MTQRRVQVPAAAGVGVVFPPRRSDCTGAHPSWYPFQIQLDECEEDAEMVDHIPTPRHRRLPEPPSTFADDPTRGQ